MPTTSSPHTWLVADRRIDLSRRGMIMGILNTTPDSFFDGGRHQEQENALNHARRMIAEGAAIIDVGGESTRPGAAPVAVAEEWARVVPLIERLRRESDILISVDTMKADIAEAAVKAGAHIINDVSALRADPRMLEVVQQSGAGLIVMHMQGTPQTMQTAPTYQNVVEEVRGFLARCLEECGQAGVAAERIALDPGIGFGKTVAHNLSLLREIETFATLGRPILIGASRKSFLGKIIGETPAIDRLWPTVALTALLRRHGVPLFRVHDVQPNREAMEMTEAILEVPGHE